MEERSIAGGTGQSIRGGVYQREVVLGAETTSIPERRLLI
jgi:hypothetical protein